MTLMRAVIRPWEWAVYFWRKARHIAAIDRYFTRRAKTPLTVKERLQMAWAMRGFCGLLDEESGATYWAPERPDVWEPKWSRHWRRKRRSVPQHAA